MSKKITIEILEEFIAEKTNDIYKSVRFHYGNLVWNGVIPKYLEKQGVEFSDRELEKKYSEFYQTLNPKNRKQWITESNKIWNNIQKKNQTYKVLHALYSGKWECRVHGPVPKVNPQPSARLSSLKKTGYVISSKRQLCKQCNKKTMHDILVMLPFFKNRFDHGNELRSAMSTKLKERIKSLLGYKDACFGVKRTGKELIIDHKFPSQRWTKPETPNPDDMTEVQIRKKFQLLGNQNNLWKSKYCDTCVKTKKRGSFMGITWYYKGNVNWRPKEKNNENGCIGCPWYDMEKWKSELIKVLNAN